MITYNPEYLDNTDIFTANEIKLLEELNQKVSLKKFLNNQNLPKLNRIYADGNSAYDSLYTSKTIQEKSAATNYRKFKLTTER